MYLEADKLDRRLFGSIIVPRPIFWISSTDGEGNDNLAPFSFAQAISFTPPQVMVCIGQKSYGESHTLANIRRTKAFIINITSEDLAEQMAMSARPVEEDEFALAGLAKIRGGRVDVPGVADAKVRLECRLIEERSIPNTDGVMVIASVVGVSIDQDALRDGRLAYEKVAPLGRLASKEYAAVSDVFELER